MCRPTWDQTFMCLAGTIAERSRDRSSHVGAVVVGPDREVRSMGYNNFPRGVDDSVEERHQRPLKYKWTAHAEANAVYNAARTGVSLKGCAIFATLPPCAGCAIAIIQAGITEVVTRSRTLPDVADYCERWADELAVSEQMFAEAGVRVRESDNGGESNG